jgi:lipoprotein-anchoring transpeptidase ErfK/SrfK
VSGQRILSGVVRVTIANHRLWQIAILAAAGTIAAAPQADAARFYWGDSDPGYYYRPAPMSQPRRQRATRRPSKAEAAHKETNAKPQGPLIIAVSIDQQKVRIYDSNGLFAESPVSTGMKGHSTPMGVFSIIQKHKMHRSNIYSGAPMPYMQRITWSGVAMHAGVLPGYPASHGCIRMPTAFAVKMWNWTRMGARVIVTPGVITPANFSHPLLVAQKVVPQPLLADEPKTDAPAVKSDKGADAGAATGTANSKPENSEAGLDLRSTVGHASTLREQTHTADARGALPALNASMTMSDAGPSAGTPQPSSAAAQEAPTSEPAKSAADAATVSSGDKPVEVKSTETGTADKDRNKIDEATAPAPAAGDAGTEVPATASVKTEDKSETNAEAKSDEAKIQGPKAETAKTEPAKIEAPKVEESKAADTKTTDIKAAEKPAEPVKAVTDAPPAASDGKKDAARLPGAEKAAAAKAEPKRFGQIAVFVSRKDAKLYVRENFKPLFNVPVTITPGDRPLGTHVFTAEADKNDPNLLRWSVVSLPVTARYAARIDDDDDRSSRRRKVARGAPAEAKPLPVPNNPAEALDRITVPPDAMARIAEALTTGGSILVSDLGIGQSGETGEGTDFIIPLRMAQP